MKLEREVGAFHRAARAELRGVGCFEFREKVLLAGGFLGGYRRVVKKRFRDVFERVAEIGKDDGVGERGVENPADGSKLQGA